MQNVIKYCYMWDEMMMQLVDTFMIQSLFTHVIDISLWATA